MTCKTSGCPAQAAHGAQHCIGCLPAVLKERKDKKLAWWRGYYLRVRRPERGHVKPYKPRKAQ